MTIELKQGDLFTSDAPIIGHGVNCAGVMGKGIAVGFKYTYPDMYRRYKKMCEEGKLNPGEVWLYKDPNEDRHIANIASQDKPGPNARYEWTMKGLDTLVGFCERYEIDRIAIPQIGCGIGGLKWADMYYRLVDQFEECPITIEVWSL